MGALHRNTVSMWVVEVCAKHYGKVWGKLRVSSKRKDRTTGERSMGGGIGQHRLRYVVQRRSAWVEPVSVGSTS